MKPTKCLFFIYLCLRLGVAYAQPEDYLFSHLDVTAGISNNHITTIYKDPRGLMWFGTVSGLNRYDGYTFRVFKHDPRDHHSIADNYIEQICEGPDGGMWVQSRAGRFDIYDRALDRFDPDFEDYLRRLGLPAADLLTIVRSAKGYWFIYRDSGLFHYQPGGKIESCRQHETGIASAQEDSHRNLWILHKNGHLEELDSGTNRIVFQTDALARVFGNILIPQCQLFIDKQDDLWFYSHGEFKGVYYYHPATRQMRQLAFDIGEKKLSSNIVQAIMQDQKEQVWLATDHGGVNIIDKHDFSVKFVSHLEHDDRSIAENSITSLFTDSAGTIWLGTFKNGISYFHQSGVKFPQYRHDPHHQGTLSYDDINNFVEDAAGNVWLASNGGGLIYFDRKKNIFRQWLHDPKDPGSICGNILVSLLLDKEGKLWIGTYFGGLDCFDGKAFTHFRHRDDDPGSLADDRVMCLCEDAEHQLWVGTLAAGMDRLDRRRKVFYHYRSNLPNSLLNDYVSSIVTDEHDNLWIGLGYGIDMLDKRTGIFHHFDPSTSKLSTDNVSCLYFDDQHRLWAATREGLDLMNPDGKTFRAFTTTDGLPDNTIRDILEDKEHRLWVSTDNGLSRVTLLSSQEHAGPQIRCQNFLEHDGLQSGEFNERAGLATKDGLLLFGGPNGFNIFRPEEIANKPKTTPILFTGLQVFNKTIQPGDTTGSRVILQKSISETPDISLSYKENVFSIEFASLSFTPNANVKYIYTLEGFSPNWLATDSKNRKATFTNLDAGDYILKVRATDEDGQWYGREAVLKITILPPWWKTTWAYAAYALLLGLTLYFSRWILLKRAKTRFTLENERREIRRMHEMDVMKIRFFTNMSHELRTPLSLILAPVDKLLSRQPEVTGQKQDDDPRKQYELIRRNARRLLHLINQLMDFRKMEVNELKLHLREGDVLKFIREVSLSFVDLAERKNIAFDYKARGKTLVTRFDHDKLERILFNLLSNAFKFTPENGTIIVEVDAEVKDREAWLSIRIIDTGIGIDPDKQEKIFEPFFQIGTPDTILNQGSGIGLSITQEFVKMHSGQLTVESHDGKGSCFTVLLPFRDVAYYDEWSPLPSSPSVSPAVDALAKTSLAQFDRHATFTTSSSPAFAQPPASAPTLLLVEDNEDFRFYLKDNLRAYFKILEASDGKEGWKKVLSAHPDLVISDISMPQMDGIELCRKIRNDERTRQIPVILLTAMTGETIELEGLQTGATDYIAKPFNFEVLLSKVRNLAAYKEDVRKTYQRQVQANPTPVAPDSADDVFMQQVLQYIEKEMGNSSLCVVALSTHFHTSRSTFYKRLVLLTGKTPVEFIRHIRLNRAAELLEKSHYTVAEVAYAVGFNNPKYFTQYFKAEFGCIPRTYRAGKKTAGQGQSE